MSDSWPAPPPGDDASDSLAGQALEVERALKALEAVDAFRAEAAALRAELQAVRASGTLAGRGPRRRPALRRAPGVPEGAWRLAAECAVIVGAAVVAWAVHLGRVGILLTLGGTWLVVAVFEAVTSRGPQATWAPPPPVPVTPPPVRAVAPPPPPAPAPSDLLESVADEVGWPSRLEPVEAPEPALEAEPEPEPEREPEAAAEAEAFTIFPEVEPDGGPSAGAFAVLEEGAQLLDEGDQRRRWWPRFGRSERRKLQEAALLEPASLVEDPEPESIEPLEEKPEVEPDGGPPADALPLLEEAAEPAEHDAPRQPRWRRLLFGRRETPAAVLESESFVEEPEPEPIDYTEQQPEGEVDLVSPAPAPLDREYGWPSHLGPIELPRQPESEAEHELLIEPEAEPETEPEPEPIYAFSAIEPDGGPGVGAFTLLEEAAVLREQPVAERPRPPRRGLLLLRRRRART